MLRFQKTCPFCTTSVFMPYPKFAKSLHMSTGCALSHAEQVKKSYGNLERARELSRKSLDYSTQAI